jgi:hypothetical protein
MTEASPGRDRLLSPPDIKILKAYTAEIFAYDGAKEKELSLIAVPRGNRQPLAFGFVIGCPPGWRLPALCHPDREAA